MAPTSTQSKAAKARLLSGASKSPKAHVSRYLKSTEPVLAEEVKKVLLLRGTRCSDAMTTVLKDMRSVLSPHSKLLTKKNVITPMDDAGQQSLEFLTTKNDCPIFVLGSHNKKRPNNLVVGRTFDRRILDVVELGLVRYRSLADYRGAPKKRVGSKPMMVFVGTAWDASNDCRRLRNLLLDLYRGDLVDRIVLNGLDHVIAFTAVENVPLAANGASAADSSSPIVIHQRTYHVKLKKDPSAAFATTTAGADGRGRRAPPAPYLTPCGPDMDFVVRRSQYALPDVYRLALKRPRRAGAATSSSSTSVKKAGTKNLSTNVFGETLGRLHLEKQNVDNRGGKKVKALRVAEKTARDDERKAADEELRREGEDMGREFKRDFGFDEDEAAAKKVGAKGGKGKR